MKKGNNMGMLLGFVLAGCLISSAFTALFMTNFYEHAQFKLLGDFLGNMAEKQPETEQAVLSVLKEYKSSPAPQKEKNILLTNGYRPGDFSWFPIQYGIGYAGIGFILGSSLFLFTFWRRHKKEILRIDALTGYLEQVNSGNAGFLSHTGEDDFSMLQDEIYKTVTSLYQMRDAALAAKNNFAKNLSNIAHQLKTPITAMSLSVQMMKEQPAFDYLEQIQRQLLRLTHLEEALLLLSRMDAGALNLEKKAVDVFTVLMLAADNLSEVFLQSNIKIDIPELGEMEIAADLDWTMEAVMNLLKNCMEYTQPGGTVHCFYAQNALYTEIRIWDEGQGFLKDELPHLFERFYRGRNAGKGGIGIGLSLAKEIIEKQNGTIRAVNLPAGGACFEIRFYSH